MANASIIVNSYMDELKCFSNATPCEKNICAQIEPGVFNGICCQISPGQQYCVCKADFEGHLCQRTAFDFELFRAEAFMAMTSKAYNNFTLMAVFLGVLALLLIALLALFIVKFSGKKRLLIVNQGENGNSEIQEDVVVTAEGEDKVDGMMLLRRASSRHTGYHSQTSYCCNPQNSRSAHCQLPAARLSHCTVIRECCPHSCPTSPTLNCGGRVASPTSPTLNGQCGCSGRMVSPALNGPCGCGGRSVGPMRLQSVPSQPSILETEE